MPDASKSVAGILLVLVPTIEFGGYSLLRMIAKRILGYLDNPVRQDLWRAGHAHAGVLVLLALVGILYVDQADLSGGLRTLARSSIAFARSSCRPGSSSPRCRRGPSAPTARSRWCTSAPSCSP